jgi:N-acetylglucosamine-6-phosphate deacetylase
MMHRLWFLALLTAAHLYPAATTFAAPPGTRPAEGLRENTPAVHALVGARIVVAPGRVIEEGALIIRDGVIEAVGEEVSPPADARIWDCKGKTLYPGLIDAFTEASTDSASVKNGAPYWNEQVTPQLDVAQQYQANAELNKTLRNQGVAVRLAVPSSGVIGGVSALVITGEAAGDAAILQARVALHAELSVRPGRGQSNFPGSPMGAVALARQAMYDARWHREAWSAYRRDVSLPRPERNDALEALAPFVSENGLVMIEANDEQYFLRADQFAREFGLNLAVCGSGHEYRRLETIAKTGRPVIVPVNFPKAPNVGAPEAAMSVSLEELMHWDLAPENAARLDEAGVKFALTSYRLAAKGQFLAAVRKAVQRGLKKESALRALTTSPAELLGVTDRVGTLEAGKAANVVITDGDLFESKTKVIETWIDGRRYEVKKSPEHDVRGQWTVTLEAPIGGVIEFEVRLEGQPESLSGKAIVSRRNDKKLDEPLENKLEHVSLRDARLAATFSAAAFEKEGVARLSAVVSLPDDGEASWMGSVVWPDDERTEFTATRTAPHEPEAESQEKKEEPKPKNENEKASFAVNYPLGAFGRDAPPEQPDAVLFQNATVWTCGEAGVLENAAVLIGKGKILAVGRELEIPRAAVVIDVQGKHITPGIIDCHSHMATDGGINEATQAITAEVRIGDFIDATDINIYRQLAGGVTAANVLHGSANPIGGQNQVIKLRWGALPEELKFAEAPPGIKFALGENVKQSNWGAEFTTRYPQSRMGVEQIIRDAFHAARRYTRDHEAWKKDGRGLPPRVDLELKALAEVVDGKRWVHCHSYRQDEILALLRTLEEFGIQIGTLQHILEGYKVADAMARHGAMGSSFSDWWAYKFEVFDAIPHNGALMHRAGIVVSFNSDDQELARHLNQEAAKAVKYGEVPIEEALKFVTLNPARQLRIDQRVGALEEGKDADLVVWSGPPLSNFSRCEQTWIDGRKYFDRSDDQRERERVEEMRAKLIQKVLGSGESMRDPDSPKDEDQLLYRLFWPREDLYCGRHGHGHDHNH